MNFAIEEIGMKKALFNLVLVLFSLMPCMGQEPSDSLWKVWEDTKQPDTTRLEALHTYILNEVLDSDPERAIELAQLQLNYTSGKNLPKAMGNAYNIKGRYFFYKGELDSALVNFERALSNYEKAGARYEVGSLQNNLGNVYADYGDTFQALNFYHQGLLVMEEYGDVKRQADILTNIGTILDEQGDYAGAIRNYRKSSEIYEQLEQNSGLTIALINLGTSTMSQGDSARSSGNETLALEKYKKALDYKFKSLDLINQLDYKWAKVYCLHDLGMIYHKMALTDTAISYLSENIELCKELEEFRLLSSSYSELATIYIDEKDFRKALAYGQMSLNIAREKGIVEETRDAAEVLYLSHEGLGQDQLALDSYKLFIRMRDSLINLANQRSLIQQEYRYEYEKKAIADSISFASEKQIQEVKLEKSRTQRQTLTFVLLVVIGFSVVLINRVRIIRKQKGTIESQNQELNDLNQNLEQKVAARTNDLRESEERYKLALDASKDGIFDLDVQNDVIKYSPAIYSMLGYKPFEFPETRQEIYNRIYSEDRSGEHQKKHEKFLKNTQEDNFIDEYRMTKKSGDVIWVLVKAKVVERTADGAPMRVVGTHTDITEEKRKTQILLETVLKTENLERSRISKDIHDGLQQTLTIASLNFQSVKKTISSLSKSAQDKFNTGWQYLQNSIVESRSVAHSLMPKAIIDFGVVSAFESLISEMDESTEGTHFQFYPNLKEDRLENQQIEVTLYRILQESLNNIIKYAKATEVNVHLSESDDMYTLIIEDNGVGFNIEVLDNEKAGMGFKSMKNRLDAINGILDISSFPGKGTTILVEINKEF